MVYYLLLTERCNLSCRHCIRGEKRDVTLSLAQIGSVLRSLRSFCQDATLVLTGGEPTIHPLFAKILACASKIFNGRVAVTSNGSTAFWENDMSIAGVVQCNAKVQISIDGTREAHDFIRGEGTFRRAIRTAHRIRKLGGRISIATVVTSNNMKSVLDMIPLIVRLSPSHWTLNPCLPYGEPTYEIPLDQWNAFVDRLQARGDFGVSIHAQRRYDMTVLSLLDDCEIAEISERLKRKELLNCGAGKNKLYIYPDMSVYGCTCLTKFPFGNLRESTMDSILRGRNAEYVRSCQLRASSVCQHCRYVSMCNGGCPGMSVFSFGDIGYGDRRCPVWRTLCHG